MSASQQIEGLVLCGGQAQRMGRVDKGLVQLLNQPLLTWVTKRLQEQVACIRVNANRNIESYEALGFEVLKDLTPGFIGPLAGFQVGLSHCKLPYLLVVPCDSPLLPVDLAERLLTALKKANGDLAYVTTAHLSASAIPTLQNHPVFCLMKRETLLSLETFLAQGNRKIDLWFKNLNSIGVIFPEVSAFTNINTPEDLEQIEQKLQ